MNALGSDLITGTQAGSLANPITAPNFVQSNLGTWWIECDRNGDLALCTYAPLLVNTYIDCTDANGNNPYRSLAVDFVGGRPPVHR